MNQMAPRLLTASDTGPDDKPRGRGRAGPFGVLDIGTTKIVCMIGRQESDGQLRVTGFGWHRAKGVRGGNIVDLEAAETAIRAAVGQAEDQADTRLRAVTVNLSCGQPESRLMNVQWPVGGRSVEESDIRRIMHEGRNRAEAEGRETIHALPLDFTTDETGGVGDPRGLHCDTLTARLHIVDAAPGALRSLGACMARCDLDVTELVSAPMAAGLAALVEDERELGATVIDLGGGTTGIAVFAEGQLLHTAQLAMGGVHVTSDIARMLSTPIAHAERLKVLYGNAALCPDDRRELLQVPLIGEEDHHLLQVPRSDLVQVVRSRIEEIFELVRQALDQSGVTRVAGNRVVLTGGASQLGGVRELAAEMLGKQVRLGRPGGLRGLPELAQGPGFATSAGLLGWAAGSGRRLADIDLDPPPRRGLIARLAAFMRERL